MNSTLQLLVTSQAFRVAAYALDANEAPLAQEMQLLVARLFQRDASSVSPRAFCQAFKNWDGEPIDVRLQQDASEFISSLFQQLERLAVVDLDEAQDGAVAGKKKEKKTAGSYIDDAFGGTFEQELVALHDSALKSRREEKFFLLQVQVKDRLRLEDALRAFVAPEVVEYSWRPKERSSRTSKAVRILAPPKHLLVHLKRFEFDLATMTQKKINTRFEFPLVLDLSPYGAHDDSARGGAAAGPRRFAGVKKKRPDWTYDLGGVVVHAGTMQSGHYYSFVREAQGGWFEYNDAHVAPFDARELDDECFGGPEPATNGRVGRERTRSAFLLVYHRRDVVASQQGGISTPQQGGISTDIRSYPKPPASAAKIVAGENEALRRARASFDDGNVHFLCRLVEKGVQRALPIDCVDFGRRHAALRLGAALCVRTLARRCGDDAAQLFSKTCALISADEEPQLLQYLKVARLSDVLRRAAAHSDGAARGAVVALYAGALGGAWKSGGLRSVSETVEELVKMAATAQPDGRALCKTASRAAADVLTEFVRQHPTSRSAVATLTVSESGQDSASALAILFSAACAEATRASADEMPDLDDDGPPGLDDDEEDHCSWRAAAKAAKRPCDDGAVEAQALASLLADAPAIAVAFAARAELLAELLEGHVDHVLGSNMRDAGRLGAIAVGCCALLGKGRYSKRGSDEDRRRAAAARRILHRVVQSDKSRADHVLAAIGAQIMKCGDAAEMDRPQASLQAPPPMPTLRRGASAGSETRGRGTSVGTETREAVEQFPGAGRNTPRPFVDDDSESSDDAAAPYSTAALRRAWRGLACVVAVDDDLRPWRVTTALSRAVANTESRAHRGCSHARTRACVDELLRLAKHDDVARDWCTAHSAGCRWLEQWCTAAEAADAGPSAPVPPMASPNSGGSFGATLDATLRAPLGAVASAARALALRGATPPADNAAGRRGGARVRRQRCADVAPRVRALLRQRDKPAQGVGRFELATYDSDDDPIMLVGCKVDIRWAGGAFYKGRVVSHDAAGHTVVYEDGDERIYADILQKTFKIIE